MNNNLYHVFVMLFRCCFVVCIDFPAYVYVVVCIDFPAYLYAVVWQVPVTVEFTYTLIVVLLWLVLLAP